MIATWFDMITNSVGPDLSSAVGLRKNSVKAG